MSRAVWTEEMDNKLLKLLQENKKIETIENELNCGKDIIRHRLREMGFEGLVDARRVLRG